MEITINLSDIEYKGLQYAAVDPHFWAENSVKSRAKIAVDEIIDITVKYCLDNSIQVPASREEVAKFAFDSGLVKTLADAEAEADAESENVRKQQENI